MTGLNTPQLTQMDVRLLITMIQRFMTLLTIIDIIRIPSKVYACNQCKCVNALTGSYIAFIEEDEFLSNPQKYIDNAYDKSENDADGYNLTKQR